MSGFLNPPSSGGSSGTIPGQFRLTGILSPAALAFGVTDDYAPAGIATSAMIRLSCDVAGSTLAGLLAQPNGTLLFLCVVAGGDLTLADEALTSAAANRFTLPDDYVLPLDVSTGVWYDSLSLRWRLLST